MARTPASAKAKTQRTSGAARRRDAHDTPPLPKGSKREGIPQKGPPPNGEEIARPKDSGRHGA